MAWPGVRLWRVCMVGVAMCIGVVWRCAWRVWVRCYGVCGYGVQALGMCRVVYGAMALGVCVWCTCVCRYIDVVSV